jgi:hypothetical protein
MWRGERNLYAFGPQEVESDLAALVDGPANGVFGRLPSMFPPPPDDRVEVSCYLAVLYFRNPVLRDLMAKAAGPRWRQEMMLWAERMLECSDDELLATLGRNEAFAESNETRRAMLQESAAGNYQLKITDPVGGHIRALGQPAIGELAWAIHERSWGLGTTHSGGHLLSSDRALAWSSPPGDPNRTILNAEYLQFPREQRDHTGDAPTSPR